MNITLAKTAGFCFGVNAAVQTVYDLLEQGKKVCTLGPIIHNPQLVKELENKVDKISNLVIHNSGTNVDNSTEKMTIYDRFDKKYLLQVYNGNVAYHIQQLWKTFPASCV